MDILSEPDQLKLVNSLVMDMGVIEGRVSQILLEFSATSGHDSQLRVIAIEAFRESIMAATSLLRREGLHPGSQGRLW